ncbi:hypothetical protein [Streptomyces sp. NPDC051567]|uniref:hypothetical protein n=1 Tax=Streptomyces sp. NPDC051567 TaxID=3365660 RepID=UPI0037AE9642
MPEVTVDECTTCGAEVKGLFHRWSCRECGTSSPYVAPPGEYAAALTNDVSSRGVRPHHRCKEVHCVCPRNDSVR